MVEVDEEEAGGGRDLLAHLAWIRRFAQQDAPGTPGVYRMLDENDRVLYIGKARMLPKRLLSYAQWDRLSTRIQRMVWQIRRIETHSTDTEAQALLLEADLIKKQKPRYNILLRDDKSYPMIWLRTEHDFPQLLLHRGSTAGKGGWFYGPFASAQEVRQSLEVLQRIFQLRSCSDYFFSQRRRPCLEYQLRRCTAPCVGKMKVEAYGDRVTQVRDFFEGRSDAVVRQLQQSMLEASEREAFELAGRYRDQLRLLQALLAARPAYATHLGDADLWHHHQNGTMTVVSLQLVRGGQTYGQRHWFPVHAEDASEEEVLLAAWDPWYARHVPSGLVLVPKATLALREAALAWGVGLQGGAPKVRAPKKGYETEGMECLGAAALLALQERGAQHSRHREWMEALAVRAGWDRVPSRIEIFDNSHWQGDSAVGVMVVATADGFERASYRRYRHDHLPRGGGAGGDDYAMMRSMLTRRMKKIASGEVPPPDLWLIDGGAAHVAIAHRVVVEAGWDDRLVCLGVAKGPDRHAGEERLHCPSGRVLEIDKGSALLHYLQVIRDEAHREAIRFHRRGRTSKALASSLDGIPGVGLARRKKLLSYFGSEKALAAASYETLAGMEGIGPVLARSIVDHLRTKQ